MGKRLGGNCPSSSNYPRQIKTQDMEAQLGSVKQKTAGKGLVGWRGWELVDGLGGGGRWRSWWQVAGLRARGGLEAGGGWRGWDLLTKDSHVQWKGCIGGDSRMNTSLVCCSLYRFVYSERLQSLPASSHASKHIVAGGARRV